MIALSVFFVAAAIVAVAALIRADRVLGPAPLGGPVAAATGRLRAP
jgi:hypothetical protein